MQVTKRDGRKEVVHFDKITRRLANLKAEPVPLDVDVTRVAAKVCAAVHDDITTVRLDELAADIAAGLSTEHPDYADLAGRILVSNHQKNTTPDLVDTYRRLRGIVSDEFLDTVERSADVYRDMLDFSRDFSFDFFGFKTLEKLYLARAGDGAVVERPQHMWLRVAVALWGPDTERVKETYDKLSTGAFTHASPTLFNAGMKRQQLASCFLLGVEDDSIEGIFDAITKCAKISKFGGGIGLHVSGVRSKGAAIRGTNGQSDGLVPMLRVVNSVASWVNQSGKRKGSIAVYLEPHHPDILDVLALKRNGGDDHLRARDLFYAMFVSDLFMQRVEADEQWSLFDPSACPGLADVWGDEYAALYERYEAEGLATRTVRAQDVWFEILRSQIETGTPYLVYKDAANAKSNQQNLGTIKTSNLCVAGDTRILTSEGYRPISGCAGRTVKVWNGHEFSDATVMQTGADQKLLTVTFDNGSVVRCTPYHKFYVETASRPGNASRPQTIRAADLQRGHRLVKVELPTIMGGATDRTPEEAYTAGFFCADGYVDSWHGKNKISVSRDDKRRALEQRAVFVSKYDYRDRTTFAIDAAIAPKFTVPTNSSPSDKLRWLEGYMDGDGSVLHNDGIENLQAASISKEFLVDVQLMLQTLGVASTVTMALCAGVSELPDGKGGLAEYMTKDLWRIQIGSRGLQKLVSMGFSPSRVKITGGRDRHHDTHRFTRVVSVEDHGDVEDTYCFNEPLRHTGMFEGVPAGNCSEILEYTSPDEVAMCNLGSLCLPTFVMDDAFDFAGLMAATRVLARNLDRVIDVTFYPMEEARRSNLRHRPVGIGVQGLQDVFFKLRMPFDSPEAAALNRRIFEAVYFAAVSESCALAKEQGPYSTFQGSPASQGRLQFDLWDVTPDAAMSWETLKEDIRTWGLRNSLSVAPMPTASTAAIYGNVEATEPITSNMFGRRTLAGEFAVVNKHLVRDLMTLGLWDVDMKNQVLARDGSVQSIPAVPDDLKKLYKTAWELSMKTLIDMAADRGAFVCQTQSMNLFVAEPTFKKLSSMHFYAWKKGLKTGMYYLRTKPAARAVPVTLAPDCIACSS